MTVIRVHSEPGRIDDAARAALAESLTKAVLDVEVGSDNPIARRGIMVMFEDVATDRWAVGGAFDETHVAPGGRVLITTSVMQGVWTAERRHLLLERFAAAIANALALGDDRLALGSCWVLLNEIDEGSWGAVGGALSLLDILKPGGFAEEQQRDARELLGG